MKLKGYISQNKPTGISQSIDVIAESIDDLKKTKTKILAEFDSKTEKIDKTIRESKQLNREIENILSEKISEIEEIKKLPHIKGEPGKSADEQKIIQNILSKIPTVDDVIRKIPPVNEKSIVTKLLSQIPTSKSSLKIIKESLDINPTVLATTIQALPASEFQLTTAHIKDLDSTIRILQSQIGNRQGEYLHGGGFNNIYNAGTLVSNGLTGLNFTGAGVSSVIKDPITGIITVNITGGGGGTWGSITGTLSNQTDLQTALDGKQATLVSATNIKTVNGSSLLGSGDLTVSASPGGSNTQVQYNNSGAFGGDTGFVYNDTTNVATLLGGVTVGSTTTTGTATLISKNTMGGASGTDNFLNITGTFPAAPTVSQTGVLYDFTGGAINTDQRGLRVLWSGIAGNTGNNGSDSAILGQLVNTQLPNGINSALRGIASPGSITSKVLAGVYGTASSVSGTLGTNIGVYGEVNNGGGVGAAARNFGLVGDVTTSAGTNTIGVLGKLAGSAAYSAYTGTAAGIFDNGTTTSDILKLRDNGTDVFTVVDGGNTTFTARMFGSSVANSFTAPTYSFTAQTGSGMAYDTTNAALVFGKGGTASFQIENATNFLAVDSGMGFATSPAATADLYLTREAAAVLQIGRDVNGAAINQTFKAHDGITGTNISGANLTIAAGRGTGAGAGGTLAFQTAPVLGSGTTAQVLRNVLELAKTGAARLNLYGTGAFTGTATFNLSVDSSGNIIETTPGGGSAYYTWSEVTGTSQTASVNNAYITNNASVVTVTLPTTAAIGDRVIITGKGAGGWILAQNALEIIHFGALDTTTGTGGSLASTNRRDTVELVCVVADTEWNVISSVGNITII